MSDVNLPPPIMGWNGPIAVLDCWCGELDRRMFHEITWPDLPRTMGSSHYSDEAVGTVDEIQILTADDGTRYVWGRGRFANTPAGVDAARLVGEGVLRTCSVEIRDGSYVEWPILDEDTGEEIGWAMEWETAVLGAFALERNPAFAGAVIVPDAEAAAFEYVPPDTPNPADGTAPDDGVRPETDPVEVDGELAVVTAAAVRSVSDRARAASAGPEVYPAAAFARIEYSEPSRLFISPGGDGLLEGEVTGHVAIYQRLHRAYPGWAFVHDEADPSEWLGGTTCLDDGSVIATGVLTSMGLHAPAHKPGTPADEMRQLIEDNALQLARVVAWRDEFGLAIHGITTKGVTKAQADRSLAGCMSVDERNLGRGWQVFGAHVANTCGFRPGDAVVQVVNGSPVSRLVASAAGGCGCGGGATASGGCQCFTARSASGEEPEPPKERDTADIGRLAQEDKEYQRARLRAAVAPKG